jgi:hypothetical protein
MREWSTPFPAVSLFTFVSRREGGKRESPSEIPLVMIQSAHRIPSCHHHPSIHPSIPLPPSIRRALANAWMLPLVECAGEFRGNSLLAPSRLPVSQSVAHYSNGMGGSSSAGATTKVYSVLRTSYFVGGCESHRPTRFLPYPCVVSLPGLTAFHLIRKTRTLPKRHSFKDRVGASLPIPEQSTAQTAFTVQGSAATGRSITAHLCSNAPSA